MPIKPENRSRYPADWKEIRGTILDRAGHRCDLCGVPNYSVGWWRGETEWHHALWGTGTWLFESPGAAKRAAEMFNLHRGRVDRARVVILTIAHLDHHPENCAPENLCALCQRCHLAHDHAHHQRNAAATRRARKASGDLFP